MFPVTEANFFSLKNIGAFVSDFGWCGFGCGGEDAATALRCELWRRWGSAEEDEFRDSEVVEKARETGGIGMIIGEILCLFLLRKLPIFPLEPSDAI